MIRKVFHVSERDWHHVRCYDEANAKLGDLEWADRPGGTVEMHLDVDPAHHRKGVGRAMLDELLRHLGERHGRGEGRDVMSLYSFSAGDNQQAFGYFTGCGFAATRLKDFYGKGRDAWFYWQVVGEPK